MSSIDSRLPQAHRPWAAAALFTLAACGGGEGTEQADAGPDRTGAGEAAAPWFEEQAAERGLRFEHVSGADGRFLMPEIMTTGAALFDAERAPTLKPSSNLTGSPAISGASYE